MSLVRDTIAVTSDAIKFSFLPTPMISGLAFFAAISSSGLSAQTIPREYEPSIFFSNFDIVFKILPS